MGKFRYDKVMPRYRFVSLVLSLVAIAIIGKTAYIMIAKRTYWMTVADREKKDSVRVKPSRGNILSCDGQLMASSLPEFKIYMDFVALKSAKNDSLWSVKVDSISTLLHN